jgi:hypothetical protein
MPTFEFRILCADRDASCDLVKGLMRKDSFVIKTVDETSKTYDHIGTIDLSNPNIALTKLRNLEKTAGKAIRNVEIAAV